MSPDELARIALRYDTTMSWAMLRALGVERPRKAQGKVRDRSAKLRRYSGARKLMAQRHGVRM